MNRREFLRGAAAFAVVGAHHRSSNLLPLDSRPPAFTLPDTDGHFLSTTPFFGHARVVLLFVPKVLDAPALAYLNSIERAKEQLLDRDLAVLVVAAPGALAAASPVPPVTLLHDEKEKVAAVYGVKADEVAFYLIGKDGGIKMARHDIPSDAELFAVIDAMPMRRQEMRVTGQDTERRRHTVR